MKTTTCWYEVETRPEELRTAFEADTWSLEGHRETDFEAGREISIWKGEGWFRASEPDLEGPLEDVIKTANLLPVISERLKAALVATGISGVQYLPVQILDSKGKLLLVAYLLNVLNMVAALNEEKSVVSKQVLKKRDGTVVEYIEWIKKTVLNSDVLLGYDIVRLTNYPSPIYVSERFKRTFEANQFSGIGFSPVTVVDRSNRG